MLTKNLDDEQRAKTVKRFFDGELKVLSCTDIASRGLDTLHVNHVINFEMPQFIADYVHRVGRVGRLNNYKHGGGNGMVTNYVTKAFEIDLVWNIERSVRLSIELQDVDANIKKLYRNHADRADVRRNEGFYNRKNKEMNQDLSSTDQGNTTNEPYTENKVNQEIEAQETLSFEPEEAVLNQEKESISPRATNRGRGRRR